jgi:hypothetical protein
MLAQATKSGFHLNAHKPVPRFSSDNRAGLIPEAVALPNSSAASSRISVDAH